jgi:hypothetical protein
MSSPFSIQAGLPVGASVEPSRSSTPTQTPPPATAVAKRVQLFVNPSFRLDPTVGFVVIEFHDNTGAVTSTIPSQRQLQAYRSHQATPPGEQPPIAPRTADAKTSTG